MAWGPFISFSVLRRHTCPAGGQRPWERKERHRGPEQCEPEPAGGLGRGAQRRCVAAAQGEAEILGWSQGGGEEL